MSSKLAEQEEIVERGLASFVEVGNALMRIRDEELYREVGFDGFVEYLESKPWGIGQAYARYQIDAAAVATIVAVANEGQARELAPLLKKSTPAVVKQVYDAVVEETGGKPTAAAIRQRVQETLKPERSFEPPPQPGVHDEIVGLIKDLNRLGGKWKPELMGRLSQADCKKQYREIEELQALLSLMSESYAPRLDSLPSAPKGVTA